MWDSNALSKLLESMPSQLSKDEFEKIQMLIDADKSKNSLLSGFDLCEMKMYAPFCNGCTKTSIYPCAIAYLNFLRTGGANAETEAKSVNAEQEQPASDAQIEQTQTEQPVSESVEQEPIAQEVVTSTPVYNDVVAEQAVASVAEYSEVAVQEVVIEEQPAQQAEIYAPQPANEAVTVSEPAQTTVKRKIRIAVARKRI